MARRKDAAAPAERGSAAVLAAPLLLRENGTFLSFPYVCAEPVLVKKIVFRYKCLKKRRFPHLQVALRLPVGLDLRLHLSASRSSGGLLCILFLARRCFSLPLPTLRIVVSFCFALSLAAFSSLLLLPVGRGKPAIKSLFPQLFLCLSRACLGKMIVLMH